MDQELNKSLTVDTANTQTVKIKDWNFVKEHCGFINPLPEMEQYCGKEARILECVFSAHDSSHLNIYTIFEDGGKYWWAQEWFENPEES